MEKTTKRGARFWLLTIAPLLVLAAVLGLFAASGGAQLFPAAAPVEELSFTRTRLTDGQIELTVQNTGPAAVTIALVSVDDAFWETRFSPSSTIPRLGTAKLTLDYPWVEGEAYAIRLITSNGLIFDHAIPVAQASPTLGARAVLIFALLGLYVGIVPVGVGLLWFPALRQTGKGVLSFILALTVGLLAFLLVDTVVEGWELAGEVPGVFRGPLLLVFGLLLSLLILVAVGGTERAGGTDTPGGRLRLAYLIAGGIGLHNLGEGLAIGTAFALGETALGTFLVIGFTLHNVTEGIGIGAPLLRDRPALATFCKLAVLAGGPAILGTWLGAFVSSPFLAVLFFGIGAGAIAQVIWEVGRLLWKQAGRSLNWLSLGGFTAGLAVMYLTALLVP
jgi:ZIP family zinc transporter